MTKRLTSQNHPCRYHRLDMSARKTCRFSGRSPYTMHHSRGTRWDGGLFFERLYWILTLVDPRNVIFFIDRQDICRRIYMTSVERYTVVDFPLSLVSPSD